jgi:hypothetical protein
MNDPRENPMTEVLSASNIPGALIIRRITAVKAQRTCAGCASE